MEGILSNISKATANLTMESLALPPAGIYPTFIFGTIAYCAIFLCNMVIIISIALNSHLHKPMHILLFNMTVNDLVGATAFFPQLIISILSQNRSISYPACLMQAVLIHLYGVGSLFILTVMAYDRYIAICCPLRYNAIMTNSNLVKMIVFMWLLNFIIITVLFSLLSRFKLCRTVIVDMYCNNPSLVKLICEDTSVNNFYGMFVITFTQGVPLIVVLYTYIQILLTCLFNKLSDAKSKAIQTCATHLVVFLFLEFNTLVTLIAHRLEQASPYLRRSFGVSVLVFPPLLNPLIYGLKTKEIRERITFYLKKKVSPF
ncbi:putative gustatory receptor clone PTE03 [Megalops cyprinoides]|uniref:putative gustatory receptor clone PTE03 n=1 Tax=Megalops cyprinoides TaxID=118141 RepID=UPI001864E805|nr:putative gustatory receptor clone PTE03 [Megalops cyprinoides]